MAVERKTFLWIGNDRATREAQLAAGISSEHGTAHPVSKMIGLVSAQTQLLEKVRFNL